MVPPEAQLLGVPTFPAERSSEGVVCSWEGGIFVVVVVISGGWFAS